MQPESGKEAGIGGGGTGRGGGGGGGMQPESGKEAGIGGGGTGGGGGATGVALLPSRETPSTLSFSFLLLISYVLLKSFSFLTTPGFPFFFCWLRAWYLVGLIVGGEGYFWNQICIFLLLVI